LDYELEFGVYIGRTAINVSRENAASYIFGYSIFNDFSARDFQVAEMGGMTGPCKSKDFATGNSIGPWIVTPDEIVDPYSLTMSSRVNGETWCSGNSSGMLHTFEDMIAYVSRDEPLFPGEFFGSGTVGGGTGMEINRFLKDGDVVELEVEGLGILRNRILASSVN
jgi:2-keto-4-pentenoate hydratase/2-oxohepta-3-ene-1,7-dioic acid hydratase in catechol pathway